MPKDDKTDTLGGALKSLALVGASALLTSLFRNKITEKVKDKAYDIKERIADEVEKKKEELDSSI
jgi:hypothetical protein